MGLGIAPAPLKEPVPSGSKGNISIEYRFAEGKEDALAAAELVQLRLDAQPPLQNLSGTPAPQSWHTFLATMRASFRGTGAGGSYEEMRLMDVRTDTTTPFAIERRIFQCSSCRQTAQRLGFDRSGLSNSTGSSHEDQRPGHQHSTRSLCGQKRLQATIEVPSNDAARRRSRIVYEKPHRSRALTISGPNPLPPLALPPVLPGF